MFDVDKPPPKVAMLMFDVDEACSSSLWAPSSLSDVVGVDVGDGFALVVPKVFSQRRQVCGPLSMFDV